MKKQAILIIAHNNLWTLKKLIECLDSDYFDIYVHIDKKSDIDIKKIKNITKKSKMYTYKNIDVSWGDISQIETEMFLLKESSTNYDYKYYHLISGNDFPIESADKIYNFFNMNYPKEYVDFASKELPSHKEDYYYYKNFFMKKYKKRKIAKVFNHILLDFQKKFKLKINQNINFKVGANWFSITDKLCKYILKKEKMVENVFRYSRSGDESFLQTLVYDSKFVENLYDKKYENNPAKSCKRLIDWNRGTPYIFKSDDYDEIVNSKCFFVRKVDENIDKKLINKKGNRLKMQNIPKIIHYCWFGKKTKPESVLRMINSWKVYCPDYKIIEWNENNFDVYCCNYVKEAYDCKKYAFVSDYARIYVLNKMGGIYLDTDVELKKNLDEFLNYDFCMSYQDERYLNTGLIISTKNSEVLKDILNFYNHNHFKEKNRMNMTSNPVIITNILKKYGLEIANKKQIINKNILILPNDYFCPMNYQTRILKITKNTYAIHWFSATWLNGKTKIKSKITMCIKRIIGIDKFDKIKKKLRRYK